MSNNGTGYGYGDGCGDGYGYGYGYGGGGGCGYGCGDGGGDGYGYGYVGGGGCGCGDGYGGGGGTTIGIVSGHRVTSLTPWNYVLVGCQCHSVDWWRDNWRYTAKQNRVSVSKSEVEDVLCKLTSCAAERTDER